MAATDLCLIADIRTQSEIPTATTTPDSLLTPLITAASSVIGRRYDREFITAATANPTTRRVRVPGTILRITPYDLHAPPATVTLHPESASPVVLTLGTDYTFGLLDEALAFRQLRLAQFLSLESTFKQNFGYAQLDLSAPAASWGVFADTASVPADFRRGVVLTVSSWLDRGVAAYAMQGVDTDGVIRPDAFMGWPIPYSAHLIFQAWMDTVI